MKENKTDRCPGCGKHCPMGSVRCKYGRKYFEKAAPAEQTKERVHKWEKHVRPGGSAWLLLSAAANVKRALREGGATEDELFSGLTKDERSLLDSLLGRLGTDASPEA